MYKRILLVTVSALAGFSAGFGLLFQFSPRAVWFAANVPGAYLMSQFAGPGVSVWTIPLGNAAAYALVAVLFVFASSLAQGRKRRASI